jgi:hypothetical protein
LNAGRRRFSVALAGCGVLAAWHPTRAAAQGGGASAGAAFAPLLGRWVRSDGRYVIHVTRADDAGVLTATYSNPDLLPFWRAQARRENGALVASFELRVGGYNGSTYELAYDPARDVLTGIYHQAVSKQSYNVQFVRSR